MSDEATPQDVQAAVETGRVCGQFLLELRAQNSGIDPSDSDALRDLRKRADMGSQDLIERTLVLQPGDAVLSEEAADSAERLSAERVWIVDPLDGTWEYGQNRSDWAVHIALYHPATRRMLVGVVDLPAQGLVRTSTDPAPRLPDLPDDRPIRIVASRTRGPKTLDEIVGRLAERLGREVEVVNVGSVGAKVNEILSGRAEGYLHDTGFYEWDLAAPLAVAKHYGLVIDHWDGSEVVFNRERPFVENIFVAHPAIADDLRASLG